MNSLATDIASDIRTAVAQRLARATTSDLIVLAGALCANEDRASSPAPDGRQRFTKIDERGRMVANSAADWVAVYDSAQDLTWTRRVLPCGEVDYASAMKGASGLTLFGLDNWKAPTIQQRLGIVDYTRSDPALDASYFDSKGVSWEWVDSSGTAAFSSGSAWVVNLYCGGSSRALQSGRNFVRGVRAGQPLALGI
jgi:hypothetical protein